MRGTMRIEFHLAPRSAPFFRLHKPGFNEVLLPLLGRLRDVHVESRAHDGVAEVFVAGLKVVVDEAVVEEGVILVEPVDPFFAVSHSLLDLGFGFCSALAQTVLENVEVRRKNKNDQAAQGRVLAEILSTNDVEIHEADAVFCQNFLDRHLACAVVRVMHNSVL